MTIWETVVANSTLAEADGDFWEHLNNPNGVGGGNVERYINGLVVHEGKKEYEVKSEKIEYNIKSENKKYKIVLDDDNTGINDTQKENIIIRG